MLKHKVFQKKDRIDRIENKYTRGIPDVNACIQGREFWIEIKCPRREPARETTPLFGSCHGMSREQMNWMLKQRRAGGIAYILIVTPERWIVIDGLLADKANKLSVTEFKEKSIFHHERPLKKEGFKKLWETLAGLKPPPTNTNSSA